MLSVLHIAKPTLHTPLPLVYLLIKNPFSFSFYLTGGRNAVNNQTREIVIVNLKLRQKK